METITTGVSEKTREMTSEDVLTRADAIAMAGIAIGSGIKWGAFILAVGGVISTCLVMY